MLVVRYVLPAALVVIGIVIMALDPNDLGIEAGASFIGGGFAVFLAGWFVRMGVKGDAWRREEEEAREYFSKHGRWPDETEDPPR
jgi:small neutral amino acid transporter SnatA (MarC family)